MKIYHYFLLLIKLLYAKERDPKIIDAFNKQMGKLLQEKSFKVSVAACIISALTKKFNLCEIYDSKIVFDRNHCLFLSPIFKTIQIDNRLDSAKLSLVKEALIESISEIKKQDNLSNIASNYIMKHDTGKNFQSTTEFNIPFVTTTHQFLKKLEQMKTKLQIEYDKIINSSIILLFYKNISSEKFVTFFNSILPANSKAKKYKMMFYESSNDQKIKERQDIQNYDQDVLFYYKQYYNNKTKHESKEFNDIYDNQVKLKFYKHCEIGKLKFFLDQNNKKDYKKYLIIDDNIDSSMKFKIFYKIMMCAFIHKLQHANCIILSMKNDENNDKTNKENIKLALSKLNDVKNGIFVDIMTCSLIENDNGYSIHINCSQKQSDTVSTTCLLYDKEILYSNNINSLQNESDMTSVNYTIDDKGLSGSIDTEQCRPADFIPIPCSYSLKGFGYLNDKDCLPKETSLNTNSLINSLNTEYDAKFIQFKPKKQPKVCAEIDSNSKCNVLFNLWSYSLDTNLKIEINVSKVSKSNMVHERNLNGESNQDIFNICYKIYTINCSYECFFFRTIENYVNDMLIIRYFGIITSLVDNVKTSKTWVCTSYHYRNNKDICVKKKTTNESHIKKFFDGLVEILNDEIEIGSMIDFNALNNFEITPYSVNMSSQYKIITTFSDFKSRIQNFFGFLKPSNYQFFLLQAENIRLDLNMKKDLFDFKPHFTSLIKDDFIYDWKIIQNKDLLNYFINNLTIDLKIKHKTAEFNSIVYIKIHLECEKNIIDTVTYNYLIKVCKSLFLSNFGKQKDKIQQSLIKDLIKDQDKLIDNFFAKTDAEKIILLANNVKYRNGYFKNFLTHYVLKKFLVNEVINNKKGQELLDKYHCNAYLISESHTKIKILENEIIEVNYGCCNSFYEEVCKYCNISEDDILIFENILKQFELFIEAVTVDLCNLSKTSNLCCTINYYKSSFVPFFYSKILKKAIDECLIKIS
ncbi:hypothetical protein COBT_000315 [Conglomerata obtusa]